MLEVVGKVPLALKVVKSIFTNFFVSKFITQSVLPSSETATPPKPVLPIKLYASTSFEPSLGLPGRAVVRGLAPAEIDKLPRIGNVEGVFGLE